MLAAEIAIFSSATLLGVEDTGEGIGRIRLSQIRDASGEVLNTSVQQMVSIGSTVHTDGWNGYNGLSELGYHISINNNNIKEEDAVPLTHRISAPLNRWLLGTHHGAISHKNPPYYLDEFTFRFNRRTSRSRGKHIPPIDAASNRKCPVPAKLYTKH